MDFKQKILNFAGRRRPIEKQRKWQNDLQIKINMKI